MQKITLVYKESLNLEHTDTSILKEGRDQYEKGKSIQVETLLAGHYFTNR